MGESKWTVEQCCCGCSLRTGSMIIAIIALVIDIIQLAGSIYAATSGHAKASWIQVIVAALHFIVSVLLIVGIRQEKRNFIMVWVWVSIVAIVISIISAVLAFIGLAWSAAISAIIFILILGYCIIVVRSYALTIAGGVGSPA